MKANLQQLEEMQKELFRQQCDLDIQKAMVKHFIKEKQAKQLTLTDVVKSLPTEEEMTLEKRKTFKIIDEEIMNLDKMSYGVGFRKCFSWLSKDKDY
jgi:peptidoglycan hydrolase CwlO-like protein